MLTNFILTFLLLDISTIKTISEDYDSVSKTKEINRVVFSWIIMSKDTPNPQDPEIKTVVIERVNADGKKVKVTQKIRTVKKQIKVSKNVLDRKVNNIIQQI